MSVFDVLGTVGKLALPYFLKFWTWGKPSLGWRDMVPRTEATRVFLVRRRAFFRSRFQLDRGKSCGFESFTLYLNMSSFLRIWARGSICCELGRLCAWARHCRGENNEIFSIVLFHPSVFTHVIDVAPDIGFRRSWCHRKACISFFLKVRALHRGELGFMRCGPTNRGRWNVPHVEGSFSDRDSGLTGGALDDPRVAHCRWSYPLP